jgi:hypothetical protein
VVSFWLCAQAHLELTETTNNKIKKYLNLIFASFTVVWTGGPPYRIPEYDLRSTILYYSRTSTRS